MTEQERVLREFYDAFNAGDLERSAAQFAADCEYEFVAFGKTRTQRSRQEVLEGLRNWRGAFPDGRVEATNVIVSGNTVVVEWDSHGTWTGAPIRGEPPNGRPFERRGCAVAEVANGKIVRCRDYFDRANMWEPLGMLRFFGG
ncbi:MAG: hypothetical protein AUG06_04385 [Actinobacteria bacterium 13_1_20CM_2_65_11]|nr:MAG: hypothetical protein AUJ02_03545 [Chloroflexi bacterium 13_1_40CM_3_65_12]OLE80550.1 MAG: hypothetical protein AUG06_04385 [Actinobacteria bacterium 13_1_20CM_2_65_11]